MAEQSIMEVEHIDRSVIEALGDKVRCTDKDETYGLEQYCYTSCGPEDPVALQNCRGVILKAGEDEVVMNSFPYTIEFGHNQRELIKQHINTEDFQFYEAYEGTLIRFFWYQDKWFKTTHRKLNAFQSKWADNKCSFGDTMISAFNHLYQTDEYFKNSIGSDEISDFSMEMFEESLDKQNQYMFLVTHTPENRIVCNVGEFPRIYHVGTFKEGNLVLDIDCGVPHPMKFQFSSVDALCDYVDRIDKSVYGSYVSMKTAGIVCFGPNNKQYKVLHEAYRHFFAIRGNVSSLKFRYLQLRMDHDACRDLYTLYPDAIKTIFEPTESEIYKLGRDKLYPLYRDRYINKSRRNDRLPREEYTVISACHKWYLEEVKKPRNPGEKVFVTLDVVMDVLSHEKPNHINTMIRRMNNPDHHSGASSTNRLLPMKPTGNTITQ